jgi:pimeloyl-ACP methyl ester carboxylesterase
MHLVCEGSGAPTVMFESYRACSYDRAGLGFSDPRQDRSVAALNDDLHELLEHAGERPPYILVGHSVGGVLVRRYAARFPEHVAGMVLVDSVHEDNEFLFPATPEEREQRGTAREKRRVLIEGWRADDSWPAMDFHDKMPADLVKLLTPRTATAAWWDARFAESALPDIKTIVDGGRLTCPLIVINATKWPPLPWHTRRRHAEWLKARAEMQRSLAARSPRSKYISVPTSHHVQLDAPQIVIDAVLEVARQTITSARTRSARQRSTASAPPTRISHTLRESDHRRD